VARQSRQSTQTIAWFRDLARRELLELDPPYQRRSVWNQAYKDYFVETIMLGYPSPAIFLYEEISPEGDVKYAVVDGKQRLTAVLEFTAGLFPVSDKSAIERSRGVFFDKLDDETKKSFWTYQFAVEYLTTTDEGTLNNIFDRINRNVAKLTPQELRHAKYSGELAASAEALSEHMDSDLPSEFPRIVSASKRQMKDVELVSQLLLFLADGVTAYSQSELDAAYSQRDEEWPERAAIEREFRKIVEHLAEIPYEMITAPATRRIRNQADFYSLFGAIATLSRDGDLPAPQVRNERLAEFLSVVADDTQRVADADASRYFEAARSASNDTGPRTLRLEIICRVLRGEWKRAGA
jgi:hypothetical protein